VHQHDHGVRRGLQPGMVASVYNIGSEEICLRHGHLDPRVSVGCCTCACCTHYQRITYYIIIYVMCGGVEIITTTGLATEDKRLKNSCSYVKQYMVLSDLFDVALPFHQK